MATARHDIHITFPLGAPSQLGLSSFYAGPVKALRRKEYRGLGAVGTSWRPSRYYSAVSLRTLQCILEYDSFRELTLQGGDLDDDRGGVVEEIPAESKPVLKRPPMFKVILINDDYTPMEFVVEVLEAFFAMDRETATRMMLTVHMTGSAVVGIYPRDIAETKSEQVNQYAQQNQHPLLSTIEMTD